MRPALSASAAKAANAASTSSFDSNFGSVPTHERTTTRRVGDSSILTLESGLGVGGEVPYFEGTRKETEVDPSPARRVSWYCFFETRER